MSKAKIPLPPKPPEMASAEDKLAWLKKCNSVGGKRSRGQSKAAIASALVRHKKAGVKLLKKAKALGIQVEETATA